MRKSRAARVIGAWLMLTAVIAAPPAAAQEDDGAGGPSSELVARIPVPFTSAEVIAGVPFEASLGPPSIDGERSASARETLLATLAANGLTPADAGTLSAFHADGDDVLAFSAIRLPGIPAADWFEPYFELAMSRSFRDPVRSLTDVGDKSVLVIGDRGGDRVNLVYPQGDVLWILGNDGESAFDFLMALETIDGGPLSADPFAPAEGEPIEVVGTLDDPVSQIPERILDADTMTQSVPVAAVIENVDRSDPEAVEALDGFVALLDGFGGIDAATIISSQAFSDEGGISIVGLHVAGADQAAFADGFVELFVLPQLDEPEVSQEQLAGKSVARWAEPGLAGQAVYVYGAGSTVWILSGQEEYVAALLRTMP